MRYHLLGGITVEQAEALAAERYDHLIDPRCSWRTCREPAGAVLLIPDACDNSDRIHASLLCAEHEREALATIRSSPGYLGSSPPVVKEIKPPPEYS